MLNTKINPYEKLFMPILLLLAIVGLLWLFSNFLAALFFAILVCSATFHYYRQLNNHMSHNKAALSITTIVCFVFVLPLLYVFLVIGLETVQLLEVLDLKQQNFFEILEKTNQLFAVQSMPWLDSIWQTFRQYLENHLTDLVGHLKNIVFIVIQSVANFTSNLISFLFISVFSLFYFYRYGQKITVLLRRLLPIRNNLSNVIIQDFLSLSIVLVSNVFLIALLQGVAFAFAMLIIGKPWFFFGILVAFASFIPVIGATLIWLPLSIYLIANGEINNAIFLIIWSVIVVGSIIDNVIRPLLLTKMAQKFNSQRNILEYAIVNVLSTFAGIIKFGILGLFLGPIMTAMAITIFNVYLKYQKENRQLTKN